MTLTQRIFKIKDWWVETNDSTTKAFQDMCGISNSYFNSMRHEPSTTNRQNTPVVERVAKYVKGINLRWLLTGEGEMLEEDEKPYEVSSPKEGAPYYNVDFLGGFDLMAGDYTTAPDSYIYMKGAKNDGEFWCNITGNSMAPLINSGSRICLKEVSKNNLLYGAIYALVIKGDDDYDVLRTVKHVNRSDIHGCVRLVPEDKKYGDYQDVRIDNILHIFRVIAFFTVL